MSRKKNTTKPNPYKPNIAYSIRKFLSDAMDKGLLLSGTLAIIVIIFSFRLPSDDILPFFKEITIKSGDYRNLGWIVSVLISITSVYYNRRLRKIHSEEVNRISEEKKQLQEHILGKLPSSKN